MTWVRLDDSFPEHPKILALSAEAFRVHVAAICHASRTLTDGKVQPAGLRNLGASRKLVTELVAAGVWESVGEGWAIHDYLDYNPSREKVLADRGKRSAAGSAGAKSRWQIASEPHSKPQANRIDTVHAPDPTRPDLGISTDLPSPSPKARRLSKPREPKRKEPTPLTFIERGDLTAEFGNTPATLAAIEQAMAHEAALKYPNGCYRYVQNWLRRDRQNGPIRQANQALNGAHNARRDPPVGDWFERNRASLTAEEIAYHESARDDDRPHGRP